MSRLLHSALNSFAGVLCALTFGPAASAHALPVQSNDGTATAAEAGVTGMAGSENQAERALRYVRTRTGDAAIRNLPDVTGSDLIRVDAGQLLAVHSESAGWLAVDLPGGMPVWIFGRYLRATEADGVFEVTRNNINLRPRPSNAVDSFPLGTRLRAGDSVAVIKIEDSDKSFEESWVQIWTPQGVTGWIDASVTTPIGSDEDGASLWSAAEAAIAGSESGPRRVEPDRGLEVGVSEAAAAAPKSPAAQAMQAARELLDTESAKPLPDFDAVRASFDRVEQLSPGPQILRELASERDMLAAQVEIHEAREALEKSRHERQRELLRRQRQRWDNARSKDPLYERFDLRGRLEVFENADGLQAFTLRQGTREVAEVVCESQRYDLDLFVGCDLGLMGKPLEDGDALEGERLRVDVTRIEVLAAR